MADSTCASQKTKPFEYFPTEHASWLRSALYCEINLSVLRSSPPESARAPASHCQRSCVSDPGLLLGDQELHELGLFLLVRLNPFVQQHLADLRDRPLFLVSDSLNVSPQRRNPERFVSTITSRRLASAPQEIDSISPVPIRSFSCQSAQGPDQTADIRGRNCFFVHKNHPAVGSLFFRPGFQQRRNRPPVISNER